MIKTITTEDRSQRHSSTLLRASGSRKIGGQIARAYQAAKNAFTAALQKAQAMGMSAEQAEQLQEDVATSGKIGASLDAANGYIAQKEQERAERAAAYRAWRVEETTYVPPTEPPVTPAQPQTQAAESELDSAMRSYMAWVQAAEAGTFDTQAYTRVMKQTSVAISTSTITPTPTATPSATVTATKPPTAALTPTITPFTRTPTITKTPLPTPTGTLSTETAVSLLKYSPIGQQLYDSLKREGEVKVEYSRDGYGHMYRDGKQVSYLFGLIKSAKVTYTIVVDPRASPTYIAGTIAHEIYHHYSPGDTLLEEYNAFLIGDVVRAQIVQAGYGQPSDLMFPLTDYNVNTSNPNLGQLIQDLKNWFESKRLEKYVKPKSEGGWGVQLLPTMPTELQCQLRH